MLPLVLSEQNILKWRGFCLNLGRFWNIFTKIETLKMIGWITSTTLTDIVAAFSLSLKTVKRNGWIHSNKFFYRPSIWETQRKYINGEIWMTVFLLSRADMHLDFFFLHKLFLNSSIMVNFINKIHFVEVSITETE